MFQRRIKNEVRLLKEAGYNVLIPELNLIKVELEVGDPYGTVDWEFKFPPNYPFSPPEVTCVDNPRILHPNVYPSGLLCLSILNLPGPGDDPSVSWSPGVWVAQLLPSLKLAIQEPNIQSPADLDTSKLFRDNHAEFVRENKRRTSLRMERKLKTEQDVIFAEVLAEDQQKDLDRQIEADRITTDRLEERDAAARLPQEPVTSSAEETISLRFRGPETCFLRRFLCSDDLSLIVLYLRSKGFKPGAYRLLTSWPSKNLADLPLTTTLAETGLSQQETLSINIID